MYNGPSTHPDTADPVKFAARQARQERLIAACTAVQGDDPEGGFWCYRYSSEFGGWEPPMGIARASDEGLARVLDRLAELAPTFTPRWLERRKGTKPGGKRSRR